jgi:hypothetical protein
MPQISLYVDKDTLGKIQKIARKSGTSISKWVGMKIRILLADEFPPDFFSLFGSSADSSISRPSQLVSGIDARRENI